MTFNSLTNETQQRIVDLCHAGDRAYVARQSTIPEVVLRNSKGLRKLKRKVVAVREYSRYDEWWGRSCSAISMVNKNLRSMAIKHLFTTLRLSKEQADIFQYSILGSPASDCITQIIFDRSTRGDETSLFTFVCRTLPLLPNLRTIKGFKSEFSRQLCLDTSPPLGIKSIKCKHAQNVLVQIATKINTWDITLAHDVAQLLLSKNYDGIESLTLQSPVKSGFPILESSGSGFLSLLSPCSNLRDLIIRHTHYLRDQGVDPVANIVLSTPFSFVNSLRSLTLDLEGDQGCTTYNEFQFITLFPSLESLNLTIRSANLDEIKSNSFLLPKLTSLKVIGCPYLHMHVLIRCLDLPFISTIHLTQTEMQDFEPIPVDEVDEIHKLVEELGAYSSSLQTFRFTSPGLSQVAEEVLSSLQAIVKVNSAFVSSFDDHKPRVARRTRRMMESSDSDMDESDEEIDIRVVGTSDPTRSHQVENEDDFGSTEELLEWAGERFKRCRKIDVAAVEELRKVLEPVKALKEWLED